MKVLNPIPEPPARVSEQMVHFRVVLVRCNDLPDSESSVIP